MKYLILFLALISQVSYAKTIRIAILDTGLDLNDPRFSKHLCKGKNHVDVTGMGIKDMIGHGTHVAGSIVEYAGNANYCLLIVKYFSKFVVNETRSYLDGLKAAIDLHPDLINYSGNGYKYSSEEEALIKNNKKIMFIVSAGNDRMNIDKYKSYPTGYNLKNTITVGALKQNELVLLDLSNYGESVNTWEIGENVVSTLPSFKCKAGEKDCRGKLSGTSMATALVTGKIAYNRSKRK